MVLKWACFVTNNQQKWACFVAGKKGNEAEQISFCVINKMFKNLTVYSFFFIMAENNNDQAIWEIDWIAILQLTKKSWPCYSLYHTW